MSIAAAGPSSLDPATRTGIYQATYDDLPTFLDLIFSASFEEFVRGGWPLRRAEFLQSSNKTCYVGPRNHIKSTGFYCHFMWKLWRCWFNGREDCPWAEGPAGLEAHYFSFKTGSAAYHIGQAKDSICALIARNPWFASLSDLKPTADTKGKWTWDGEHEISLDPHGMLSHTRGIHCELVFVDDPFDDPENDLKPTQIIKINDVFRSTVKHIPTRPHHELHIATTPQTDEDFTFDGDLLDDYHHLVQPAVEDHAARTVIWPEWMDYDALMQEKREIGEKLFNQEFMCSPKSSEVGFFAPEDVGAMVVPGLRDWATDRSVATANSPAELGRWLDSAAVTGVVGGLDIGKKRHPSHLAVFAVLRRWLADHRGERGENKAGHLVQVHQKWMDKWDYTRQVGYCSRAIDFFDVDVLAYDATRGEFESLDEQGALPDSMEGVSLSGSTKSEMAGALDVFASDGRLKLLDDGRQSRQLAVVTNDLDAVETNEGHGEPFTSIGLACRAAQRHSWTPRFGTLET